LLVIQGFALLCGHHNGKAAPIASRAAKGPFARLDFSGADAIFDSMMTTAQTFMMLVRRGNPRTGQ